MLDAYVVHRDDPWSLDAVAPRSRRPASRRPPPAGRGRAGPSHGSGARLPGAIRERGLSHLEGLALQGLMFAESPFGVAKISGPYFAFEQITDLIVVVSVGCR